MAAPDRAQAPLPRRRASLVCECAAIALSLLVLGWLITYGDWELFPPGGTLEGFYDAQAVSLLHGRIDVEPAAIGSEAYVRHGRSYGYFGPTPALARIPAEILLPDMHGRWSRFSMLVSALVWMAMAAWLFRRLETSLALRGSERLRDVLRITLIAGAGLGSVNLFLMAESKVYEEALAWGAVLTVATALFLLRYLTQPARKFLILACASGFLAFFTRVSIGAGALAGLALLDLAVLLRPRRMLEWLAIPEGTLPRGTAIILSVTLLSGGAAWTGLNYWKFGLWLNPMPMQLYVAADASRVTRMKGNPTSPANLPLSAAVYLSPANIRYGRRFPWVYLTRDPNLAGRFPSAHLDMAEPYASLPASNPGLLLAALAGLALCFGSRRPQLTRFRLPLAAVCAGGFFLFLWGFISYRYLHDWSAWLVMGAAISLAHIPLLTDSRLRNGLAGLAALLVAYSIWTNFAFAIVQQRFYAFPIPQPKRVAFEDFTDIAEGRGLGGMLEYAAHRRMYLEAAAFNGGNVAVDRTEGRGDQTVIYSPSSGPSFADYLVQLPADGRYEVAVRCAGEDSRPLLLVWNDRPASQGACGVPTGGWTQAFQKWSPAGQFDLRAGAHRIRLARDGPFPAVSAIRLIRRR
jgi:hypothetical protein